MPQKRREENWQKLTRSSQPQLRQKNGELNHLASLKPIGVIGVTETWLHEEIYEHEIGLPGYAVLRQDCPSSDEIQHTTITFEAAALHPPFLLIA